MDAWFTASSLALVPGLGIGAVIGVAALLTNFCALGAVADILFAKDWRRMRAWMLAAGVAVLATQGLATAGLVTLAGQSAGLPWLALLTGGLAFGYGMALSGGCINRALVRLGAGSLKSLVIVGVVAVTAAMTAGGVLAPLAGAMQHAPPEPPATLAALGGQVRWIAAVILGGGLTIFALKDRWFRSEPWHVAGSAIIGAMIPLAWLVTTRLAPPPTAVNFAGPTGDLLAFLTGASVRDGAAFAVAVVAGVPVGAFLAAASSRNLALETFTDRADLPRNLAGAALMGIGGTVAGGCTFGQGLSGLSTLAVGSVIVIAAMIFGCLWGIRSFEAGSVWGGLKLAIAVLAGRRVA